MSASSLLPLSVRVLSSPYLCLSSSLPSPPQFKGKVKDMVRYCMLDTAEFLNHQHCELVLLPSHKDAKLDLGKVVEDMEREADDEAPHDEAAVYDKLDTDPKHFPDAAESFK